MKKYIYYPIIRIISFAILFILMFIVALLFFPLFIFTGLDKADETCNYLADKVLVTLEKYGKL